jgi:hypothetical protein
VAAPQVAELRAVDLDEDRIDRPQPGAVGGDGADGPHGRHVAGRNPGDDDDEAEEDEASVHAT